MFMGETDEGEGTGEGNYHLLSYIANYMFGKMSYHIIFTIML